MKSQDTFETLSSFEIDEKTYHYYSLPVLGRKLSRDLSRLPYSLKILLENLLRHEDGIAVDHRHVRALLDWDPMASPSEEIAFTPARVILQDFTGVPAVVDLAAMREAMVAFGGDPQKINPQIPSELVIDHSVQVDSFASPTALKVNLEKEFERNQERYEFLKWGQTAFENFRVVPPATGIVHQVNLEYLARVVFQTEVGGKNLAYPDTLVGTDSHTTMINGLGVLGWGVGGIEAEAAMLGQAISLLIPQVVGFRLEGRLQEGATATDLVLTITEILRDHGVVGKFVEFFGPGISNLSLADRATLGNMSPEYGATCAMFPIDDETLRYLRFSARDELSVRLVERYAKEQGLFQSSDNQREAEYSSTLGLSMQNVEPSIAGPKRPQDRIPLRKSKECFEEALPNLTKKETGQITGGGIKSNRLEAKVEMEVEEGAGLAQFGIGDGSIVIAAITSCTNTSNPSVMIAAGLVARNAVARGLRRNPWVKTSLAPGSKIVTEYLDEAGLTEPLEKLGFHLVGYGCTTCIGNSGPLPGPVSEAIRANDLVACSILSGNRNFEGRISPDVRANYLASPPLVVAYSLAGRIDIDLSTEPLGRDRVGRDVFLKDLWPSQQEVQELVESSVRSEMFASKYSDVFAGDKAWQEISVPDGDLYAWDDVSTYIKNPPFFEAMEYDPKPPSDISGMRVLAYLGDSVTTDHISPAGSIPQDGPAGKYLLSHSVQPWEFNSFGSRRGNHEVMMRGTFANIRLRNHLLQEVEGGYTRMPNNPDAMAIYDAAMTYRQQEVPLMVIAGKEYGSGSSRDWAAKGTRLLGVKVVLAESYERIHRSNLIGMGVLPLQFEEGMSSESLKLTGAEVIDVIGLSESLEPGDSVEVIIHRPQGDEERLQAIIRIDTPKEVHYYSHGGILHYVLRTLRDAHKEN
jgi:aconitate hydratase